MRISAISNLVQCVSRSNSLLDALGAATSMPILAQVVTPKVTAVAKSVALACLNSIQNASVTSLVRVSK